MAEMLIQSESLTSIADKIRVLSGTTESMSLDDMETELGTVDNAVTAALSALVEKGVEVPEGTNVTGLAELIAAIEAGGSGGGLCTTGTLTIAEDTDYLYIPHDVLAYEGSVYPKFVFICPVIRETQNDISDYNFGGCVIARFEDNTPLLTSKYANLPGDYFQYGRLNTHYRTPYYLPWTKVSYNLGMSANSGAFGGGLWSAGTEFFYGCIW